MRFRVFMVIECWRNLQPLASTLFPICFVIVWFFGCFRQDRPIRAGLVGQESTTGV